MYQQSQLPVSPLQVDGRNYQPGAPHRITIRPVLQLPPHLQQFTDAIIGYSIAELQEKANNNPIRVFCYNYFSFENWCGPEFIRFCTSVASLVDLYMRTPNGATIEQIIAAAAERFASYSLAILTSEYPELQQFLTSQQQQMEIGQLLQEYQGVEASIKNMMYNTSFNQPNQFQNNAFNNRQQTAQPEQFIWRQNQAVDPRQMGVSSNAGMKSMFDRSRPVEPIESKEVFDAPQYKRRQYSTVIEEQPMQDIVEDGIDEVTFADNTFSISRTPKKEILGTLKSGLKLASESKEVRTFNPAKPYGLVYNPKEYLLIQHKSSSGAVSELPMKRTEVGMGYQDHEIDPVFKAKAREDILHAGGNIIPIWDLVISPRNSKTILSEHVDTEAEEAKDIYIYEPVILHDKLQAHTFEEAYAFANLALIEQRLVLDKDLPFEFSYRKMFPFFYSPADSEWIKYFRDSIENVNTFETAVSAMNKLVGMIPANLWHFINDRLTKLVNDTMAIGIGINNVTIDGFTDDINSLIPVLNKKFGAGVVEIFNKEESKIVKKAFRNLKGSELVKYIAKAMVVPNDAFETRAIVFFEDHVVTMVPWYASEINIRMKDKIGMVKESLTPDFYNGIKSIVSRNNENRGYSPMKQIRTLDNVEIQIHESIIGVDTYLISI